jgi:mono/diheme cytochrome c family protein
MSRARTVRWTTLILIPLFSALQACSSAGGAARTPVAQPVAAPRPTPTPNAPATLEVSSASGIYSGDQAARGQQTYTAVCAACHSTSDHSGAAFAAAWGKHRLFDLYQAISNEMPQDKPGSLTDQQYIDVVAYLLQLNGMPAGVAALRADTTALKLIRINVGPAGGRE